MLKNTPINGLVLVCLLNSFITNCFGQDFADSLLRKWVDKTVEICADQYQYGLAIGLIEEGKTTTYFYGKLDNNKEIPPNSQHLFQLGSISKVFTATLLHLLVKDSIVQLSDPITKYLPDSIQAQNPSLSTITLYQLATHTSGLPFRPNNVGKTVVDKRSLYANYTLKDLYSFLATHQLIQKKRRKNKFAYSHLGVGLLGHLLENASQLNFQALLTTYLNTPLTLQNTGIHPNIEKDKIAIGHNFSGQLQPITKDASLYASEGIYSNLKDLLLFMKAHIDTCHHLYPTLQGLLKPQYPTPVLDVKIGYAWFLAQRGRRFPFIVTHSGQTNGYSNYLAFIPDRQIGIVVLSNSHQRIDELGIRLLEILINR